MQIKISGKLNMTSLVSGELEGLAQATRLGNA